jgi:enoyl-CoA hydratase/carnithine racemase
MKDDTNMPQRNTHAEGYVRLDADGLPVGILEPVPERRVTRLEVRPDGIALLTLNRPEKLNAFDERMIHEVRSIMWQANFDDRISIIVITGAGRAFCSGRDINGLDYENNLPTQQYRA